MISSSQRPLPHNTQHSQQTNIHAHGGILTHDLSRRAALDLCFRPRGYWDRLETKSYLHNNNNNNNNNNTSIIIITTTTTEISAYRSYMTISSAQEFIELRSKFKTISAIHGYIQTYRRSAIRYNFLYDVLIAVGYMLLFTDL